MFVRAEKNKNYSVINNTCFKDPEISARAKGIFAYIMTLPDNWELKKYELCNHFSEGRKAVDTAFKELETKGYIVKKPRRIDNIFNGWDYTVHETPTVTDLPKTDESGMRQSEDGQEILNTKLPNTKLLNTDNKYTHTSTNPDTENESPSSSTEETKTTSVDASPKETHHAKQGEECIHIVAPIQKPTSEAKEYRKITELGCKMIHEAWNTLGFKKCRLITDKHKRAINGLLSDKYTLKEILNAIEKYKTVVNSTKYYYSYKFTSLEFFKQSNACRKFIESEIEEFLNYEHGKSGKKKYEVDKVDEDKEFRF